MLNENSTEKVDLHANFLLAQRLQTLGDVYRELNDAKLSEETYNKITKILTNMFGEDHPCIL